ncbi:MAG: iron-sulfur cluster assembly protein [Solirubrobacterales bacterium]|nr:iron-sulfur cluster assembly protein [Solirubrobacterales bacterium]
MTPVARERVFHALAEVHDPELDEPITSLGFVSSCEVGADGDVEVVLRLPTPQCAPNFAFLMAADARGMLRGLPGVRGVTVRLEGHYTGREINAALDRGEGFAGAFPGETADEDLEALRELFLRKALVARQSRLCDGLRAAGETLEQLAARRVADLPDVRDAHRCLELRRRLGLRADPDSAAFVLPSGEPVAAGELGRWLRTARLVRMSLEVNGGICRSLLRVRHGVDIEDPEEEVVLR